MDYELVSKDEYASLSEDDEQCFVEFEAICRRNMTRMIDNDKGGNIDREIRYQYMAAVSSVALECGIQNLKISPFDEDQFYDLYRSFSSKVQGEVARILVRRRHIRNTYSVLLTTNTKTKIEHHISRIRDVIKNSDLPFEKKRLLNDKLDQLIEEIGSKRVSFAKAMAILSVVLLGLPAATTVAADGPTAVTNIMKLIGRDKESEDAATFRLAPPQQALPAPQKKPVPPPQNGKSVRTVPAFDDEDEIPF